MLKGIYFRKGQIIRLNLETKRNEGVQTCVMAKEMGHHFTGVGDCISPLLHFQKIIIVSKKERGALKGVVFLLPVLLVKDLSLLALKLHEVVEWLQVTVEVYTA